PTANASNRLTLFPPSSSHLENTQHNPLLEGGAPLHSLRCCRTSDEVARKHDAPNGDGLLQVAVDVVELGVDGGADAFEHKDRHNGDQGEDQRVLDQALAGTRLQLTDDTPHCFHTYHHRYNETHVSIGNSQPDSCLLGALR